MRILRTSWTGLRRPTEYGATRYRETSAQSTHVRGHTEKKTEHEFMVFWIIKIITFVANQSRYVKQASRTASDNNFCMGMRMAILENDRGQSRFRVELRELPLPDTFQCTFAHSRGRMCFKGSVFSKFRTLPKHGKDKQKITIEISQHNHYELSPKR